MPDPQSHDLNSVFAAALNRVIGQAAASSARLGIAVSGGPDSMALLDLAVRMAPGRVEAATVDHGFRPEAADEAAMVARWCVGQGVAHEILRPVTSITGSLQAEARAVRYALLDEWMAERRLDWLLTAHHADDQLETMIMRLNRASGVAGLAGIRVRRGRVLRPLLDVRKADLEHWVREQGIPHANDPSNGDARFDRARLRRQLADVDWLDPVSAARSASALADAEAALEWTMASLATERVRQAEDVLTLDPQGLPREYARRLLAHMVQLAAPEAPQPRGEQIDQAILQLYDGRKLSLGACVVTGGPYWTVRRAPPRRKS